MKAIIDTNVILDAVMQRQQWVASAQAVLSALALNEFSGYLSASQITDLHYIIHRNLHSEIQTRKILCDLLSFFTILPTNEEAVFCALQADIKDFEDALLAETAQQFKMDFIITRNLKDFIHSNIPAVSPETFLEILAAEEERE